jgi:uncharacterized protein with HEPN domain
MTRQKNPRVYLQDMLRYAHLAEQFVEGMNLTTFAEDEKTQIAVLHTITIIGEAANKIPAQVRDQYPHIPWRIIIDTRNRIIHEYEDIMLHLIWNVVQDDIPPLKAQIAAMLAELES